MPGDQGRWELAEKIHQVILDVDGMLDESMHIDEVHKSIDLAVEKIFQLMAEWHKTQRGK